YESGHLFGEAAKDKSISLYAHENLAASTVKIYYHDANHLGTVHGFTLYTTETKGDIYFYVQADFAGTFTVTANGAMLRANGSVERSAALGSMTLTAVTGNTALNFSSDYLRTSGNGQARFNYNKVWLYTEPYTNVTLYMDDVAIAETGSVNFGLATFSFAMNDAYVGSASTSSFKEKQRDWTLTGFHELYAETENGIRTPIAIMECLTEAQFTPAVISSLNVTTYMDDGKYCNNVTVFNSGLLTNHYFSPSDTGHIFSYKFTATVEAPDSVEYLYVLVYDNNGVEYAAKLEREAGKNTFAGTISGERLLFTNWAIVLRSKDPNSAVQTALLSDDIISLLGADTVITDPYGNNSTVQAEYERALAEAQAMAEDGSLETEMSFYFDVYADLINEIAKYYNEEGFALDDSEESINAMLDFFGYTIGVAADVDYQSWGDDHVSATLPDGREMRAHVTFELQPDGRWLYVAETVVLPTYDDPEGYSQVQRMYYEEDANTRTASGRGILLNGDVPNAPGILPTYDADATAALQNLKNRFTKAYQNIAGRQESERDAIHWNKRMQVMETLNRTQNQHTVQTKTNLSMQARLADLRDLGPEKLGQDNYNKVVSCLDKLNRICDAASVSDIGTALSKVINAAMNCTITGRISKAILDMSKGYLAQKFEEKFGYEMPTSLMGAADLLARLYFSNMLGKEESELFELLMELDRLATELGVKGNLFDAGNLKVIGGGNTRAFTDPQGIVYEAVLSNPVEGATATIWERNAETGEESVWNAEDYGQTNPQTTNSTGMYQWFVPEGEWQVRVTAPEGSGLSDNTSAGHAAANLDDGSAKGWLPVMPVQMGINIPLVSSAVPEIAKTTFYHDRVEIVFSLYMDVATLQNAVITVYDGGEEVPCTVRFPDMDVDPADETKFYAKTAVLMPMSGSFDEDKNYSVTVAAGATAYNGKALASAYDSGEISVIPHEHVPVFVPCKDPTDKENGNVPYYVCLICGRYFENEDCLYEITDKDSVIIPKTGPNYVIGDADGDGEVTDWDAMLFERYLAFWKNIDINLDAMDIDGDGELSDWDAIILNRYLAYWPVVLGGG
ncbi:MAG: Ig-like domain-containing protein, partial [Clostridia bacterium]|nr:Ig-like domain-containing protein [Clostridia bacterium]